MPDSSTQFMDELEKMGGAPDRSEPEATEGKIQYSSHPVLNYRIGTKYVFENGLLTLDSEADEKDFLTLLHSKKFPARDRSMIKKLDLQAAERISRAALAKRPHTTQQIDSSIGERPNEAPRVGVGDLLDTNRKREDLGLEAAAEGGRQQNVPGAPDSNRETQTEPSPQPHPEAPFRAETQGQGGSPFSTEQLMRDAQTEANKGGPTADESLAAGKLINNEEAPAVEAAKTSPLGGLPQAAPKE